MYTLENLQGPALPTRRTSTSRSTDKFSLILPTSFRKVLSSQIDPMIIGGYQAPSKKGMALSNPAKGQPDRELILPRYLCLVNEPSPPPRDFELLHLLESRVARKFGGEWGLTNTGARRVEYGSRQPMSDSSSSPVLHKQPVATRVTLQNSHG